MTVSADAWLTDLATKTALELARRADRDRLSRVNERDHLQPCCALVARSIARSLTPPVAVSTTFRFQSRLWPRLGRVDIALLPADGQPIAIELKCGMGRDALGPCAWDALKLAFALQLGAVSAAYLLAASPAADWKNSYRGAELFANATFDTLVVRERFLDWWRQWERLGDPRPIEVPRQFATRVISRARFVVDGVPWQLRVAELSVGDEVRIPWPSTLAS